MIPSSKKNHIFKKFLCNSGETEDSNEQLQVTTLLWTQNMAFLVSFNIPISFQ